MYNQKCLYSVNTLLIAPTHCITEYHWPAPSPKWGKGLIIIIATTSFSVLMVIIIITRSSYRSLKLLWSHSGPWDCHWCPCGRPRGSGWTCPCSSSTKSSQSPPLNSQTWKIIWGIMIRNINISICWENMKRNILSKSEEINLKGNWKDTFWRNMKRYNLRKYEKKYHHIFGVISKE